MQHRRAVCVQARSCKYRGALQSASYQGSAFTPSRVHFTGIPNSSLMTCIRCRHTRQATVSPRSDDLSSMPACASRCHFILRCLQASASVSAPLPTYLLSRDSRRTSVVELAGRNPSCGSDFLTASSAMYT